MQIIFYVNLFKKALVIGIPNISTYTLLSKNEIETSFNFMWRLFFYRRHSFRFAMKISQVKDSYLSCSTCFVMHECSIMDTNAVV